MNSLGRLLLLLLVVGLKTAAPTPVRWPPISPSSSTTDSVVNNARPTPWWRRRHPTDKSNINDNESHNGPTSTEDLKSLVPQELLSAHENFEPVGVKVVEHDDFFEYEVEFVAKEESTEVPDEPDIEQEEVTEVHKPFFSTRSSSRGFDRRRPTSPRMQRLKPRVLQPQQRRSDTAAKVISKKLTTPNDAINGLETKTEKDGDHDDRESNQRSKLRSLFRQHQRRNGRPSLIKPTSWSSASSSTSSVSSSISSSAESKTDTPFNRPRPLSSVLLRHQQSTQDQGVVDHQHPHPLSTQTATTTATTTTTTTITTTITTTTSSIAATTRSKADIALTLSATLTTTVTTTTVTTASSTTVTSVTSGSDFVDEDSEAFLEEVGSLELLKEHVATTLHPVVVSDETVGEKTSNEEQDDSVRRIPRIIDNYQWDDLTETIFTGQYHEMHPGQYHEINPGQYHEINPGQYHEVNPGQYHEANPGQYKRLETAAHQPTAPADVNIDMGSKDPISVHVEQSGDKSVYTVQSKVDDFIIGEYGTFSNHDGQPLKGVRYTAVDDSSVDPELIKETLAKFFNFS